MGDSRSRSRPVRGDLRDDVERTRLMARHGRGRVWLPGVGFVRRERQRRGAVLGEECPTFDGLVLWREVRVAHRQRAERHSGDTVSAQPDCICVWLVTDLGKTTKHGPQLSGETMALEWVKTSAVDTCAAALSPPTDAPSPEAALDELLKPLSSCGGGSIAPKARERGLPGGGCQLAHLLEEIVRRFLVCYLFLAESALDEKRARRTLTASKNWTPSECLHSASKLGRMQGSSSGSWWMGATGTK